jgi:hypothetical protein
MFSKYMAAVLPALTIAGILIIGCEKSNGPEPYLCSDLYDSLVLMEKTNQGSVPMGPAIPLDSLEKLVVTDGNVQAIVNIPEYESGKSMVMIRKIIFK